MFNIESKVIQWAKVRGIFDKSDPKTQCLKTVSEVGELADAVAKGECIKDHIGDAGVTLINLAYMHGTTLEECLGVAFAEIENRTGRMVNGTFVKDEA
jgi:NTP pyrophosphatase (non-canonical NTP hydrolase)